MKPLKYAGAVGKGVVFAIEHGNPIAMLMKSREADPEHPRKDQMLIDLHNQVVAVREDMVSIGETLGITVNLPPLTPTVAETRQLVEQTSLIAGVGAIQALEEEPPPKPEEIAKDNELRDVDLSSINSKRLRETGFAYLETDSEKPFTGRANEYHSNGEKKMQVTYWKGRSHGPLVRWHANGKKNFEVLMDNNLAEGEATEWYPSGRKFRVTPFSGGQPHGTVTVWDEEGKVISQQDYENGELLKEEE